MKSFIKNIFSYESLFTVIIVVGFGAFVIATESTLEDPNTYVAPTLSQLHISHGVIDIKRRHKKDYKITLDTLINNKPVNLEFLCNPPGRIFEYHCAIRYLDNKWQGFRGDIDNKQAIVWWADIPGTSYKKIYQLEVNGHKYINYDSQVKYYMENKPPK